MEMIGHLLIAESLPNAQEDKWDPQPGHVNRMISFPVIKPRFLGRPARGLVTTLLIL